MVTKTRPRPIAQTHITEVELRTTDRNLIAESLGLDHRKQAEKLDKVVDELQLFLKLAKFRLRSLKTRPLAANIVAALQPIADSAAALSAALDLTRMSHTVWTELTLDINALANIQEQVAALHELASNAIERLSGGQNRGKDATEFSDSLTALDLIIERIFEKHFIDDLDVSGRALALIEFQKICRKYLPASPNRRGKKKTPDQN